MSHNAPGSLPHLYTNSGISSQREDSKYAGEIVVKGRQQPHLSLGEYDKETIPKGFSVEFSQEPMDDAIITQITRVELPEDKVEFILHIANYSDQTIRAEIWEM